MSLKAHAVRYGLKIIGGSGSDATIFAGSASDLSTLAVLAGESSLGSLFLRSDGVVLKKETDTNQVSDWVELGEAEALATLEGRVDDIDVLLGTLATDGTYTSGTTFAGDIDALDAALEATDNTIGTLATDGTYTSGTTVAGDIDALDAQLETNATQIAELEANQDDLVTLSGVAENSTDLGTFTGTTISDAETVKGALQDLETALEASTSGSAADVAELTLNQNDLITLTGVAENSTDLGTFTGTTIADGLDVKSAIQSLETQLEAQDVSSTAILEDGSNTFTADQSMGSNRLTDLAAPINDNDAARKVDVDAAAAGMLPKDPVRVASTADVGGSYVTGTISGLGASLSVDGVSLVNGDRVLLKNQVDPLENGIYVYDGTDTLVRSEDMDGSPSNEVKGGNSVFVNEGLTHADNMFRLDGQGELTLDIDALVWVFFSRAESVTASTGLVKSGLDLQLADAVASNGIAVTSGAISAQVDDTTIEISGTDLAVKDGGISEAKLGSDVDADTFALSATYASSAGTVTIGDSVETAIEKIVGNIDALDSASSADIAANTADIADIRTTQGTSDGDTNLGTFTGTTISDNNTVKGALQELETAVEGNDADIATNASDIATNASNIASNDSDIAELVANQNDLVTLTGVAENSTDLGTFTGATITDANDVKGALQELETAVEGNDADIATNASNIASNDSDIAELVANQNDLVTLTGVAENSTDLGTFTGSTITDANDVKGALQELETAHEALDTEVGIQSLESSSAAVTTSTVLDSIALADAKIVKWVMYGSLDSAPTTMEAIEVTAFHDGVSAVAFDVKSILNLGLDPIDVDVVINGSDLELQIQAVSATSYTAKRDIVL